MTHFPRYYIAAHLPMASNVLSQSTSKRPNPTKWSWWDEAVAEGAYKTGRAKKWTCKYCLSSKTISATRIWAHLLHISGHEIALCTSITSARREELRRKDEAAQPAPSAKQVGIDLSAYVQASATTRSTSGGMPSFFGSGATPFGAPPPVGASSGIRYKKSALQSR